MGVTLYPQAIAEMGKSDSRELEHRIAIVFEHMLKLDYVGGVVLSDNLRGWQKSVETQRRDLIDHLADHPGLKPRLTSEFLDKIYRVVVADLRPIYPQATFPSSRPWSWEAILG
jgi:hypothetical protein